MKSLKIKKCVKKSLKKSNILEEKRKNGQANQHKKTHTFTKIASISRTNKKNLSLLRLGLRNCICEVLVRYYCLLYAKILQVTISKSVKPLLLLFRMMLIHLILLKAYKINRLFRLISENQKPADVSPD